MFGFPNCPPEMELCNDLRHLLTELAYLPEIQEHIVQAEVIEPPAPQSLGGITGVTVI